MIIIQEQEIDGCLDKIDYLFKEIKKRKNKLKEANLWLELNHQEEIFQNQKKTKIFKIEELSQVLTLHK